jgi:hypothetical protein
VLPWDEGIAYVNLLFLVNQWVLREICGYVHCLVKARDFMFLLFRVPGDMCEKVTLLANTIKAKCEVYLVYYLHYLRILRCEKLACPVEVESACLSDYQHKVVAWKILAVQPGKCSC